MRVSADNILRAVSIAGSLGLVLLLGMCWGMTNVPPADFVRKGLLGIVQMGKEPGEEDPEELEEYGWYWARKRSDWEAGVSINDPERTSGDYTIYAHPPGEEAILIDMNGAVVHRWSYHLADLWDESAVYDELRDDVVTAWSRARLEKSGDLYVVLVAQPIWPYGRGLVKLDKDSKVIWKNLDFIHHSFDIDPEGNIYALAQRMEEEISSLLRDQLFPRASLTLPFLNDYLLVIDEDGSTIKTIDLAEAIAKSPYAALFNRGIVRFDLQGDYLHANDVEYVTETMARSHPYARPGDVVILIRNLSALVVLDVGAGTIRHAIRGPWVWPHDPDLLDNGNILIFDNQGHIGEGGSSRIVEFDPATLETKWEFHGDSTFHFETDIMGSQERLANGNTLITESMAARIYEVTRQGEVVWEYWNPVVHDTRNDWAGSVRWGERFTSSEIEFPFNGGTIADEE